MAAAATVMLILAHSSPYSGYGGGYGFEPGASDPVIPDDIGGLHFAVKPTETRSFSPECNHRVYCVETGAPIMNKVNMIWRGTKGEAKGLKRKLNRKAWWAK